MPPTIPIATYRIQLTKDFGFDDAAALAPYLKRLGITHLYASPFLKARPGSTHGYDIVDHERLNPDLGGDEAFARLSDALKQHDLGLILDFVPYGMGVGHSDNAWWLDVLEWGPKITLRRVLRHRLGCVAASPPSRGSVFRFSAGPTAMRCRACEIELKYDAEAGSFAAWCFDHKLPINPQRYRDLVRTLVQAADASEAPAGKALLDLAEKLPRPGVHHLIATRQRSKRSLAEISGAAEIIEHGLPAFRSDNESGDGLCCTGCWSASITGSLTGASPFPR